MSTTYTRTPEGELALSGSTGLGETPLEILRAVGTGATDALLRAALSHVPSVRLEDGMRDLVERGLVRISGDADSGAGGEDDEQMRKAQALRAKLRARRHGTPAATGEDDAEAARQREADEQARRENEAREAEARRRLEQERLERVRREDEEREARDRERRERDKAEREARERERLAAEEHARREAEERAVREAREADERAAREAGERQAREKAERERREAEAQERAAAAELMRQRAEVQARLIEEERAWLEAERRAKAAETASIEQESLPEEDVRDAHARGRRGGKRWLVPVAVIGALLLVLVMLPFIPISGRIATMEGALTARFGEPVRIGAVYLGVLPRPHLRLEDLAVGNARQVHVRNLKASGGMGVLGGDLAAIGAIDIESPTLSEEGLAWLLFGKPGQAAGTVAQVQARGVKLESKMIALEPFDATLHLDENGGWKSMNIVSADKGMTAQLTFLGNGARVVMSARRFAMPVGPALLFEDFSARVDLFPTGAQLHEFKGFAYGGWLSGNGKLARGAEWIFSGTLDARRIDVSKMSRAFENAWLAGNASFLMRAPTLAGLGASLYLDGTYAVANGILHGIDLGKVLQGGSTRGGLTDFTDMRGSVVYENGVTRLQRISFAQSKLSAGGNADIGTDGKLQGRLVAEIKLPSETRRAFIGLSGSPDQMEWLRQ